MFFFWKFLEFQWAPLTRAAVTPENVKISPKKYLLPLKVTFEVDCLLCRHPFQLDFFALS